MAIVQVCQVVAHGTNSSVNSAAINTQGCSPNGLLVAIVGFDVASPPTLTDSAGNTWSALNQLGAGTGRAKPYYCLAPTTSSTHTFSLNSGSASYPDIAVMGFSGVASFDAQGGSTNSTFTNTYTPTAITPTNANSLVVAGFVADQTSNHAAAGWNVQQGNAVASTCPGIAMGYQVQSGGPSAAAPVWTWTTNSAPAAPLITFNPAAAAATNNANVVLGAGHRGSAFAVNQALVVGGI